MFLAFVLVAAGALACCAMTAEEICADDGASVDVRIIHGLSSAGWATFKFVCNEAKDKITKCVLSGEKPLKAGDLPSDGFDAGPEPVKFGGQFGNLYEFVCSEKETPKKVESRLLFSEQVCNTEAMSNKYTVEGIPDQVKVTFTCNERNTRIDSCKAPWGRKIKATKTGKFGGTGLLPGQFKLYCSDKFEPTFPK